MLSCFNLKPGSAIDEFRQAVDIYTTHLLEADLVDSTSPIGHRRTDTIMDTDSERDHQYFFTMSFRDRAQCDRAVETIYAHEEPGDSIHKDVYSNIVDQIFICWEDL